MRQQGGRRFGWIALVLLWTGVVCPAPAVADDAPSPAAIHTETAPTTAPALAPPLTLTLALDEVLHHHPALLAARHQQAAARYRIPQARAINDPMVSAEIEGINGGRYDDIEYSASQEWPFPGKRGLRGRIAQRDAEIIDTEADTLERELIAQVKTAYFALYRVERAIEINRHNRTLLEQVERVAESKYASGGSSMQDVLKAQVELAKLSNELINTQQERTTAIARLNTLMNRAPETPVVIVTKAQSAQLPYTLEELERRLAQSQPALRAAALAVRRDESELKLAKLGFLPDVTTRVETRQYRGGGGLREFDVMLAMNVPLWFWGKQRARVQEAGALLAAATATQGRVTNEALFALRDAYARVAAARESVRLYETSVLPQAEQSLKVAQAGYEADRASFFDMLDAERSWKEFQLQYQQALVTCETAWADLERAVGQPLEKSEQRAASSEPEDSKKEVALP